MRVRLPPVAPFEETETEARILYNGHKPLWVAGS